MNTQLNITALETASGWFKNAGPDINPKTPDGYEFMQVADGIVLYCCGDAYAGWLSSIKSDLKFFLPSTATFKYNFWIDDATLSQQVIETDTKLTDANGYTYDCSAQWNIAEGWMFQIDKPPAAGVTNGWGGWIDTGIKIPPPKPYTWNSVAINYAFDYNKHTSSVLSVTVNGNTYAVPSNLLNLVGLKVGWAPSEMMTQLQQCIGAKRGAYSVKFGQIGYGLNP